MSTVEVALLLLLLATWAGLLWVYRRLTGEVDDLARERVEHSELQSNIAQMVSQLQQAADELGEALAARTGKLQELLAQADRRIAEYAAREALAAATAGRSPLAQAGPGAISHGPAPRASDAAGAAAGQPVAAGDDTDEAGEAASYGEVRRLAAEGLDPVAIAQRTNRGREEVRLLLQLGQLARSAGTAPAAAASAPAAGAVVAPEIAHVAPSAAGETAAASLEPVKETSTP